MIFNFSTADRNKTIRPSNLTSFKLGTRLLTCLTNFCLFCPLFGKFLHPVHGILHLFLLPLPDSELLDENRT